MVYDAIVPRLVNSDGSQTVGYGQVMLVSISVRNTGTGDVVGANTKALYFQGEMHIGVQMEGLGNLFGNLELLSPGLSSWNSSSQQEEQQGRRLLLNLGKPVQDSWLVVPSDYDFSAQNLGLAAASSVARA
jgi:hypothetical protein